MTRYSAEYNFNIIEKKWQLFWDKNKTFEAKNLSQKPKYYILDMFPYPSGAGLHVGHPAGYIASDIIGRYKKAQNYNVLHPMGWDAFGLPAEQHAIATGVHPAENTQSNIANFKKQLKALGFGFDWSRELNTTDPDYYRWTQFIFLKLFQNGLAYVDEKPVWWCEALGTVLANEEVIDGRSERGNHPVERRNLRQWVLRITAYAERLLDDLREVDWPDSTKRQQIAWIGRSEGTNVYFEIDGRPDLRIETYTTRVDTLCGVTYIVLAPEHPLVKEIVTDAYRVGFERYSEEAARKSELKRTSLAKDKTGVFTGAYAIHPITSEKLPLWVADYVLISYGTGAVMAVPAHDERDFDFAKAFQLPMKQVLIGEGKQLGEETLPTVCGTLIQSGIYDGLNGDEARVKITQDLQKTGRGTFQVNYKLRDWLFSRQRYWGEPFPIVWIEEGDFNLLQSIDSPIKQNLPPKPVCYTKDGNTFYALPVLESHLPVKLPDVKSYQPEGGGESPLAKASDWLHVWVDLQTGKVFSHSEKSSFNSCGSYCVKGLRESNTMPQWAGSCWYYLRYLDPQNTETLLAKDLESYWGMPDLYLGGAEHAVLHLLYARFWHKVLYDLGMVSQKEPFKKLRHQGLILGEMEFALFENDKNEPVSFEFVEGRKDVRDNTELRARRLTDQDVEKHGDSFVLKSNPDIRVEAKSHKMSKSRGNVINPDDVIAEHGTDALRLYEMFLGPFDAMKPWNGRGIEGLSRFLKRLWREYINTEGMIHEKIGHQESPQTTRLLHETIQKVSQGIEGFEFNTAISQMMILLNHIQKEPHFAKSTAKAFIQILAPFAPHICEELWVRLGGSGSIADEAWPSVDKSQLIEDTVRVIFQVNGRLRGEGVFPKTASNDEVIEIAKQHPNVSAFIDGKPILKVIYVPARIVNFVTQST